ncbi:MAG: ATPase [Gammaproteobacteria bacterium]|nr:ATPase [Gammaproteobacteria bacterium]
MEDELKRLLDAEARAEAVVDATRRECERLIQQAHEQVRASEQRVEEHVPELRSAFYDKAEERANLALAELERRYHERSEQLRSLALKHSGEAVDAAFALIIDPDWE